MNQILSPLGSVFISLLLISSISACTVSQIKVTPVQIKRLVFLNQSSQAIEKVKIYITETREHVSCGYILPKSECSTGFPLREYQGHSFDVSWSVNGRPGSIKNVQMVVPEGLILDKPVNAVIVFGEQGKFSATLKH